MAAYKKFMKASWNVGKHAKGDGEERLRGKREIKQEIVEAEAGFQHRYIKSRRNRNKRVSLESRIQQYDARYTAAVVRDSSWAKEYYCKELVKARKQLRELLAKQEKSERSKKK